MKKTTYTLLAFGAITFVALLGSCTKDNPDSPGFEYMPDLYRSASVETNGISYWTDSILVNGKWVANDSVHMGNKLPPEGTIPRGFTVFPYANTPQGDTAASMFWKNPMEHSDKIEDEGKALYTLYCVYCHGDKGDGKGKLVESGKYSANPPDYKDKYTGGLLTDGHVYHVITYGKGNMGSHASQVSPEERWKIIEYVQRLGRGGKSWTDWNAEMAMKAAAPDSLKKAPTMVNSPAPNPKPNK